MVHLKSSLPFSLVALGYLHSTVCLAAALRNPGNLRITQLCTARPHVSLPDDNRDRSYNTSSGFDCLDAGNPHDAECWNVLQLDEWLPQWFLRTPQCSLNAASETDCNKQDPPEPWTTTFMRSAARGGDWNGCSDVGSTNCQYSTEACFGGIDPPLLRARYKYVAYTISSMYHAWFLNSLGRTFSC